MARPFRSTIYHILTYRSFYDEQNANVYSFNCLGVAQEAATLRSETYAYTMEVMSGLPQDVVPSSDKQSLGAAAKQLQKERCPIS